MSGYGRCHESRMDPGGGYQLTDDGFAVLISFEGHFAITNKEREVEQVLYRLAEIFWVDDELEEVGALIKKHLTLEEESNVVLKQILEAFSYFVLHEPPSSKKHAQ